METLFAGWTGAAKLKLPGVERRASVPVVVVYRRLAAKIEPHDGKQKNRHQPVLWGALQAAACKASA